MDKNKIKSYAVWARRAMIQGVSDRAHRIGIEANHIYKAEAVQGGFRIEGKDEIFNFPLSDRNKLISLIDEKGYEQVMEEVAYTWFNRFMGLRYMEVNEYLPMGIRILSSETEGKTDPDVFSRINEVIEELDLKADEIYALLDTAQQEDKEKVYRKILIAQCNKMGEIIPQMFEKIKDYTELLLPDNLLEKGSVINKMVTDINEEDWREEVEIIGWMYQYYISEKKDEVFAALKNNVKISKENIPAATQLFTPKWIVKYMVENSLGRLWLEGHPNESLQSQFNYYLTEAKQESSVEQKLIQIRQDHSKLMPEDIKVLDPCMGSGHMLVYAFDVLYQIYLSSGYSEREIPRKILQNNLYGMDIDDRAAQLSAFTLVMKARHYNRRLFRELMCNPFKLNICSIQQSNELKNSDLIRYFVQDDIQLREDFQYLIEVFTNSKEIGSLLKIKSLNISRITRRIQELSEENELLFSDYRSRILAVVPKLLQQANIFTNQYEVCITNPPYLAMSSLGEIVNSYVKEFFEDYSLDFYAAFISRCLDFTRPNCKTALITQHSWMFVSGYEQMRCNVLNNALDSLIHLGSRAFEEISGEVVQTAAYIFSKFNLYQYNTTFIKLNHIFDSKQKEIGFFNNSNNYVQKVDELKSIPKVPLAYWINNTLIDLFKEGKFISSKIDSMVSGNKTANNEKYIRFNWEVSKHQLHVKWFPYAKGGTFRKWYGNIDTVIDWSPSARNFYKTNKTSNIIPEDYWFKSGISYTDLTSKAFNGRLLDNSMLFDMSGPGLLIEDSKTRNYILALLNSKVGASILSMLNSSFHVKLNDIARVPLIEMDHSKIALIDRIVNENILLSKKDWERKETSMYFEENILIKMAKNKQKHCTISDLLTQLDQITNSDIVSLKSNEELLNTIFIDSYGLNNVLESTVSDDEIAISPIDKAEEVKNLISYIIGTILENFTISSDNLITNYIIPLTDDVYFKDDIINTFALYIGYIFGKDLIEDNLDYISSKLNKKANETSRQCIRRYLIKDFYKDHVKLYQKRPIYWLFDSGKENGFKAIISMYDYNESTIAKVRTDYLHVLQKKYEVEIQRFQNLIETTILSVKDKTTYSKQIEKLKRQLLECQEYDQVVAHLANERIKIDLDDGVKVNYAKFQDVKVINRSGKEVKMNLFTKI